MPIAVNQQSEIFPKNRTGPLHALLALATTVCFVVLTGCSSSHTLELEASQPVYFGHAPEPAIPLDSAHVRTVKSVLLTTSHQTEKEATPEGTSPDANQGISEKVVGDVAAQIKDSLGDDPEQFIAKMEIRATLDVSITWAVDLFELFTSGTVSNLSSDDAGRSSSETFDIQGTVFKKRSVGQ